MIPKEKRTERMNNLELAKAMHTVVKFMNHEDAEEAFAYILPPDATEDDFLGVAEDAEEMEAMCQSFRRVIRWWGKHGWFTNYAGNEPPFNAYGADKEG